VEGAQEPVAPPPPDRRISLEDEHEVEEDRRRRVVAALVYGDDAPPDTPVPGPWMPLVAGLALALAVMLIVGMGTLVRGSLPGGRPSPGPHPSPAVTARR